MSSGRIGRRIAIGATCLLLAAPGLAQAAGKPRVEIRTARGTIVVELENRKAPLTTANFLHYVDTHAYDGGTFYRAARTVDAPKQGTIVGGPRKGVRPFPPIAHESTVKTGLKHLTGTISLGRFQVGTATDAFFICASPEPYLDAHPEAKGDNQGFAAFGEVVSGMDVVRRILALPTNGKTSFKEQRGQWLTHLVPIISMRRVG
jgi:peptidyl-prolyl cis-trans isomerase A (cyclophilin A)